MRKDFAGYYPLREKELEQLWSDSLIVLDANVLLNLHRWSRGTRDDFVSVLGHEQIKPRLWMPHQVGVEFHRNRPTVIAAQRSARDFFSDTLKRAREQIAQRYRYHDFGGALERLDKVADELVRSIEPSTGSLSELLRDDAIAESVGQLYEGRLGPAYAEDRLKELYRDGKTRYEREVPPGYADKKPEPGRYGDLILWRQILDKAKQDKRAVIFVSDDRKEDWWAEMKGETIGPRPELSQEMWTEAAVPFHMYAPDQFLIHAQAKLKTALAKNTVPETSVKRAAFDMVSVDALSPEVRRRVFATLGTLMTVSPETLQNLGFMVNAGVVAGTPETVELDTSRAKPLQLDDHWDFRGVEDLLKKSK